MDAVIILIHPFAIHILAILLIQLNSLECCPIGLNNFMVTLTGNQGDKHGKCYQ